MKQRFHSGEPLLRSMETFRYMTNDCIRVGLEKNLSSMKKLSLATYKDTGRHQMLSYYRLCAISKAAGILAARKKSINRGFPTKSPYLRKPLLTTCYGFEVRDGRLHVPLDSGRVEVVTLTPHTLEVLADPAINVRSFTLTPSTLSLCLGKDVEPVAITGMVGVDRNLHNVTAGNNQRVSTYDFSETVRIGEMTREIVGSFKRNDVKIRRRISGKYGRRRSERVKQILHRASKTIVEEAKKNRQGIAFEDVTHIRGLYRRGNGQGSNYRGRMNSWPFFELKRQVEYKAAWLGVPVIQLSRGETMGTSRVCVRCGERLRLRRDRIAICDLKHGCGLQMDRDRLAAINIARRGLLRFDRSKGGASEAMVSVLNPPVDAPKLTTEAHRK